MAPALLSRCGTASTPELNIIVLASVGNKPSLRPKPSFMLRLRHSLPNFTAGLLTCHCFLSLSLPGGAGELPDPPTASRAEETPLVTPALEEALRQLKEQQASTFEALDLIRNQTESALQHNASILSNQLVQFSTALAGNSERQLQFMRETERRTLYVTMLILLAVLLGVAALVAIAARSFNSLAKRCVARSRPRPTGPNRRRPGLKARSRCLNRRRLRRTRPPCWTWKHGLRRWNAGRSRGSPPVPPRPRPRGRARRRQPDIQRRPNRAHRLPWPWPSATDRR